MIVLLHVFFIFLLFFLATSLEGTSMTARSMYSHLLALYLSFSLSILYFGYGIFKVLFTWTFSQAFQAIHRDFEKCGEKKYSDKKLFLLI